MPLSLDTLGEQVLALPRSPSSDEDSEFYQQLVVSEATERGMPISAYLNTSVQELRPYSLRLPRRSTFEFSLLVAYFTDDIDSALLLLAASVYLQKRQNWLYFSATQLLVSFQGTFPADYTTLVSPGTSTFLRSPGAWSV